MEWRWRFGWVVASRDQGKEALYFDKVLETLE